MTEIPCTECERPVADGAPLCKTCGERIIDDLNEVPGLLAEFAVYRAGLARMSVRVGSRSTSEQLPISITTKRGVVLEGDPMYHRLVNAVTTWTRVLAEELGQEVEIGEPWLVELAITRRDAAPDRGREHTDAAKLPAAPPDATAQAAVWLAMRRHELRAHDAARDIFHDIGGAVAAMRRLVDRPVERRYLGACTTLLDEHDPDSRCGYAIRAEISDSGKVAAYAYCGRCRTRYDVADIDAKARATAMERVFSLAELVHLTRGLGERISRATIYRWAQQRRIEPVSWGHVEEDGSMRITDHKVAEEDVQMFRLKDLLDEAGREPVRARKGAVA